MLKIDHPKSTSTATNSAGESKTEVNSIWTWANNIWQHFSHKKEVIFSPKPTSIIPSLKSKISRIQIKLMVPSSFAVWMIAKAF